MSTHTPRSRRWVARISAAALLIGTTGAAVASAGPVQAASGGPSVTGAVSTTVNPGALFQGGPEADPSDLSALCQNGNPLINCNQYYDKKFVWLSGLPDEAGVNDGTYFFSILVPGGQGANDDANPNDGTDKNLSDTVVAPHVAGFVNAAPDGSSAPSGDDYTNRTFTITDGAIGYNGTHDFENGKIRAFPYDDTTNPGGVYILAVCRIDGLDPAGTYLPGINPSLCKYDAFKVITGDDPGVSASGPEPVKDAAGSYTLTYDWTITKDAYATEVEQSTTDATFDYTVKVTHDAGTISGVTVSGTINVFNPNDDAITGVDVVDQLSNGVVCDVEGGSGAVLDAGDNFFAYTCALSAVPEGVLSNVVTASWGDQDLGDSGYLFAGSKSFEFAGDDVDEDLVGDGITFTATAANECIALTDYFDGDLVGTDLGQACIGDAAAGEDIQFTYTNSVTDAPVGTCTDYDNDAVFVSTDEGSTYTDSDDASVRLCVGADLTVSKDFTPSFTRTYDWSLSKNVDKTEVKQVGGSATFNYTVTARQTGYSDGTFGGSGIITVTNPNDWQDVVVDIGDDLAGCTVTDGQNVTVPRGLYVTRSYSCALSGDETANTASITWDQAASSTPTGSATSAPAEVSFAGLPTSTVDASITVTDTFNGVTTTLGTLAATNGAPYPSATYTYPRTVPVPATGCRTYDNTATIVETEQTASKSVTVCGPAKTGGLTMGFWQNKNGQGIITGGGATPTVVGTKTIQVCNSGTWLTSYNPFKDLKANATCAEVGAYVTSIIKAANASGASMNAMLKAQMLATSLDVYFSNGGLGGNKINAPAPIGGVSIDLTKVCKNIASCTVYENTSSAFGGASSATVAQLLALAAAQSGSGGSPWYGQVKATQELAKDTFDAINNQVAFGA